MLDGLLFYRVITGDNQHRHVHSGGAGEHLANEFFVARNVHDANFPWVKIEKRISQFDRDTAFFLLGKSIGRRPRQGFNKRSLSVVNVASGAQNQIVLHKPSISKIRRLMKKLAHFTFIAVLIGIC